MSGGCSVPVDGGVAIGCGWEEFLMACQSAVGSEGIRSLCLLRQWGDLFDLEGISRGALETVSRYESLETRSA